MSSSIKDYVGENTEVRFFYKKLNKEVVGYLYEFPDVPNTYYFLHIKDKRAFDEANKVRTTYLNSHRFVSQICDCDIDLDSITIC